MNFNGPQYTKKNWKLTNNRLHNIRIPLNKAIHIGGGSFGKVYEIGKKYILKGTNRHQDMMSKGSALTQEDHEKDLQLIKKMGCNFLRLAHYTQDPYVLKRANELGLLIWEEIPLVNYMNINNEFLQNCSNMLKEMMIPL
jgi:hypothetical protein